MHLAIENVGSFVVKLGSIGYWSVRGNFSYFTDEIDLANKLVRKHINHHLKRLQRITDCAIFAEAWIRTNYIFNFSLFHFVWTTLYTTYNERWRALHVRANCNCSHHRRRCRRGRLDLRRHHQLIHLGLTSLRPCIIKVSNNEMNNTKVLRQ